MLESQPLDTSTHETFYQYYAEQSLGAATLQRYRGIRDAVLRSVDPQMAKRVLDVVDIGCGAGTQCFLWTERGHVIRGLDINQPLIELARKRATEAGLKIEFRVGSATQIPWPDAFFDVCLVPELLEHVVDWETCVREFARILRPGGWLYISTTNWLCPVQEEFTLPLYSWYPNFIKRQCERLAVSTRPEWVNHAKYPAVNWFSFYSLRGFLDGLGFDSKDRFDIADTGGDKLKALVVGLIQKLPPLRLLGYATTPATIVLAHKRVA